VGIIRRRNLSDKQKLNSAKWRHAVSSVDWLTTQLPPTSQFQIYTFNEKAMPLMDGTGGKWIDAGDVAQLNAALTAFAGWYRKKGRALRMLLVQSKR
jgi:hypothetical protein